MRTPASRRSRRAARAAGVLLLTAAAVVPALAQPPDTVSGLRHVRVLEVHEAGLRSIAPTLIVGRDQEPDGTPAVSQHPYPPLLPAQSARLQQARTLRANGQLEPARSALLPLLAETAHHPEVVTEQARLLLARGDFAGAERLGRAERTARRDSLLVTLELAAALERLGRPREAAAVALEAWLATPPGVDWARDEFERLASADARGARDLLRRASAARPARADLLRTAALLDWRAGDRRAALEALERAERPATRGAPLRWDFAAEAAAGPAPEDSAAAAAALVALAGDSRFDATWRLNAARRAWELQGARGGQDEAAPALARALGGVPAERWPGDFLVTLARALRRAGRTDEARALVRSGGAARRLAPQLDLEEVLTDLRDGPPERVLSRLAALAAVTPEGAWYQAEALFFAGRSDSALGCYRRIAADPQGPFSGAALERVYLLEDAAGQAALPVFGRIAYEQWRGERRRTLALADSLVQALPRGPLWAQAALLLADERIAGGDPHGALAPLLAVADSLPDDRLAPLARQRAGDLYRSRLGDERAALSQYEECLARYPRAWNAPEVRRVAETLRRGRRIF